MNIGELEKIRKSVFGDGRGNLTVVAEGLTGTFFTLKRSFSRAGVFRGMHYQVSPKRQEKVIEVISGRICDIAINMDSDSAEFGKVFSLIINDSDDFVLKIPAHYAHGFYAYEDTVFQYITIGEYSPEHEMVIKLPREFEVPGISSSKDWIVSPKDEAGIDFEAHFKFAR